MDGLVGRSSRVPAVRSRLNYSLIFWDPFALDLGQIDPSNAALDVQQWILPGFCISQGLTRCGWMSVPRPKEAEFLLYRQTIEMQPMAQGTARRTVQPWRILWDGGYSTRAAGRTAFPNMAISTYT
jgi:hypothetical protein